MTPIIFKTSFRCEYHELDPNGHLNTAHYISRFLAHRMSCIRDNLGYGFNDISKLPYWIVTKSITTDFHRPVYGDQIVDVESYVESFEKTRCQVLGHMRVGGKLASSFKLQLACVDKSSGRPMAWPEKFISEFYTSTGD